MTKLNGKHKKQHENLNLFRFSVETFCLEHSRETGEEMGGGRVTRKFSNFHFISVSSALIFFPSFSIHFHLYKHLNSKASAHFIHEKMEMCLQIKLYEIREPSLKYFLISVDWWLQSFQKRTRNFFFTSL